MRRYRMPRYSKKMLRYMLSRYRTPRFWWRYCGLKNERVVVLSYGAKKKFVRCPYFERPNVCVKAIVVDREYGFSDLCDVI